MGTLRKVLIVALPQMDVVLPVGIIAHDDGPEAVGQAIVDDVSTVVLVYLTQSNQIKGLTKTEYEALREMCRCAKNLYNNVGWYSIRQYFFLEGRYLRYESNCHAVKDNANYALMQAGVGQQILKVVDRAFRSFFNLLKQAKQGEYRFHDVKMPHYLEKDG